MDTHEVLRRGARAIALATVAGLLVMTLVSFGESVHRALDPSSLGEAYWRSETTGLLTFAALVPALFLTPLPDRHRRWGTGLRAASGAAAVGIAGGVMASIAGLDAANWLLILVPPAFAGLILTGWPFPERGEDTRLGRWGELLAVPEAAYLGALAVVVLVRPSPVDWGHDGLWVMLLGPALAYALLWFGAWWLADDGSKRAEPAAEQG